VPCLVVLGCGDAPPREPAHAPLPAAAATTGATAAAAEPSATVRDDCQLVVKPLPASTPAAWGSVRPGVWLTRDGEDLRAWYPSGYQEQYRTAPLQRDGALGKAEAFEPFASLGEAGSPAIVALGDTTVVVDNVYTAHQDADIFVALRHGGSWSKPIAVRPHADLDSDPAVAMSTERIVVAWSHGKYPSAPHIAVAVLDHRGRVLHADVVEKDAEAEGIAVVAVPKGFLVVYTPSSALHRSRHAIVTLALDEQGAVRARHVVPREDAIWPVAAWNGREVGVVVSGRGTADFLRFTVDGEPIDAAVVADDHPDPIAMFRPLSLLADKEGWWLADVVQFAASVIVARASEGRVARLDPTGRRRSLAVLSQLDPGASIVRIAAYGSTIRGVMVEDRGDQLLRAFDVDCGTPAAAPVATACDARESEPPAGSFTPLRDTLVESAMQVDNDLVLGLRPFTAGRSLGDVAIVRVRPDGTTAWTTGLGAAFHPAVAAGHGAVAALIKTGSGAPESLALLDAASGTLRSTRELASDVGDDCIAATAGGWLVARGAPYGGGGSPATVLLDAGGKKLAESKLDDEVGSCTLLAVPKGFLLAYTHGGDTSETSWLFVRELDERGKPRGPGRRIDGVHFATGPQLGRAKGKIVLLFSGPLGREIRALALDEQGQPKSAVVELAQSYGLLATALWNDELVYATKQAIGRRGCLDTLLAR
jgi:hypothetical protein